MKAINYSINAKQLLRILTTANKSAKLGEITRLFVQREQIRASMKKLREKQKQNTDAIREATMTKQPEQFQFKF